MMRPKDATKGIIGNFLSPYLQDIAKMILSGKIYLTESIQN
jgi:hypothetical protein